MLSGQQHDSRQNNSLNKKTYYKNVHSNKRHGVNARVISEDRQSVTHKDEDNSGHHRSHSLVNINNLIKSSNNLNQNNAN